MKLMTSLHLIKAYIVCVHAKRHLLGVVVPTHWMEVSGQIQALSTSAAEKEPLVSVRHDVGWAPDLVWTF